jgi:hypothetical protein
MRVGFTPAVNGGILSLMKGSVWKSLLTDGGTVFVRSVSSVPNATIVRGLPRTVPVLHAPVEATSSAEHHDENGLREVEVTGDRCRHSGTDAGQRDSLVSPGRSVPTVIDPFSLLDEEFDPSEEFQGAVTELPREVFWAFLGAVLLAQVGLFAASLGLMLAGFRGQLVVGGTLFVGGVLALGGTFAIYYWVRASGPRE